MSEQGSTGTESPLRFSLRELMLFTAAVAVYLAAYVIVLRDFGGTSEPRPSKALFVIGQFVGAGIACCIMVAVAKVRAGKVCVRLPVRLSLHLWQIEIFFGPMIVLLLALLIPAGIRLRVGLISAMTFGAVFFAVRLLISFVDLCDNGIISHRIFYVPWRRLRPNRCRLDEQGNLEIGKLWFRYTAHVPPELRGTIEQLLDEKL
jgi:hypothetical protein